MADTFTTNLNLTKPEPGAAEDTWGISLNADLDALDAIFSSSGTQINLNPNQINFADNKKAVFGAGSDLEIYSDGTHSYIEEKNASGNFYIKAESFNVGRQANSELYMTASPNGAVSLYHDNAVKLATTSTGLDVTGNATFGDNGKAVFGAGNDLQIYHDGSNSYVKDAGTGSLRLRGTDLRLESSTLAHNFIVCTEGGSVTAYHNDSSKFSTTATGINVTGVITTDGLTTSADINFGDNDKAVFGAGSDLQIYHDSSDSFIKDEGDGNLRISSNGAGVEINKQTSEYMARFLTDGAVELYHNNNKKLETTSTGIDVTGTVTNDGLRVDNTDSIRPTTDTSLITISGGNATNSGANYTAFGGTHATLPNIHRWRIGGSEAARIDASGRLGIGTSSPDFTLDVEADKDTWLSRIYNTGSDANAQGLLVRSDATAAHEALVMGVYADSGYKMVVRSNGRVGIGTTSPSYPLEVQSGGVGTVLRAGTSFVSIDSTGSAASPSLILNGDANTGLYRPAADTLAISTGGSERLRLNSSGNLGIGTSSPDALLEINKGSEGEYLRVGGDNASNARSLRFTSSTASGSSNGALHTIKANSVGGEIAFANGNGNIMYLDVDRNVGIGTDSPNSYSGFTTLTIDGTSGSLVDLEVNGTVTGEVYADASNGIGIQAVGSRDIQFKTNNTEALRIDSSQNVMVGGTSSRPAEFTHPKGISFRGDIGQIQASTDANTAMLLNRDTSDGTIAEFRKDGTSVGSIGVAASDNFYIGASASGHAGLYFDNGNMVPMSANLPADDAIDLGSSLVRFDDIYATNGTIQTSDINEKQDIEDLTDAETRVAVAAKGLLKKYRWKSAVEEKGDDARIHFGIMAQDLQNAFTAEGLDAGDYGMFISTTWTDDDGVEQTRLGVRYNELLAFIIAAI